MLPSTTTGNMPLRISSILAFDRVVLWLTPPLSASESLQTSSDGRACCEVSRTVYTAIAGSSVPLNGCPDVLRAQVVQDRVQDRGCLPGDRGRPQNRRGRPLTWLQLITARTVGHGEHSRIAVEQSTDSSANLIAVNGHRTPHSNVVPTIQRQTRTNETGSGG